MFSINKSDKDTILITGGSKGIGKQLFVGLSKKYNVVSINRQYSTELEQYGKQIIFDLTACHEKSQILKSSISKIENLYAVINNAAVLTSFPLIGMPDRCIFEQIHINLTAAIIVSKISLPTLMKKRNSRIINIGSMSTEVKATGDAVYAASKAGLSKFTELLSNEVHKKGVTVNTLSVSATPTGMLSQIVGANEEKILKYIPNNRLASSDDIANIVNFYLSKSSGDITGQNIFLGGVS